MTDWSRTVPLGVLTKWLSGGTPTRGNPAYWGGPVPWISAATLKVSRISTSDQTLTELGVRAGSKMAPTGSILILVRGMALHRETRIAVAARPLSFNQDVKALIPKKGVSPEFLLYALQARSNQILDLVSSAGSGTGVLDTKLLQRLLIWVPDPREQELIVEALTSVDGSVESLERLIAKKHAMKQGLMQQLLTGRTRLAGFSEPWRTRSVADLVEGIEAGVSVRSTAEGMSTSGSCVLKTSAVDRGRFDPREAKPILGADLRRARLHPEAGAMIMSRMNTAAMVGDVGFVEQTDRSRYLPDRLWLLRASREEETDMRWLTSYFVSESGAQSLRALATGTSGSMKSIPKDRVLGLQVPTPSPAEQRAVSAVLVDADAEIDGLRRRLAKARAVKTGMMQELLTGRVRLQGEASS